MRYLNAVLWLFERLIMYGAPPEIKQMMRDLGYYGDDNGR